MRVVYRFSPEHKLVLAEFSGDIGTERFIESYADAKRVVDATGAVCAIADFSAASLSTIRANTILSLASSPPVIADSGMRCVVAPADYMFGITRMFQIVTGRDMHICRSLAEAYKALGITEPAQYQVIDVGPNDRIILPEAIT